MEVAVVWRDLPGYEGLYKVSNTGLVYSNDRFRRGRNGILRLVKGRILRSINVHGYLYLNLINTHGNRSRVAVHRIVASVFIKNEHEKETVNHKNGVKTDNRVDNLEWNTQKENNLHAIRNGLIKKTRDKASGRFISSVAR